MSLQSINRDGTAPRGGLRITVNGTEYIVVKADVSPNASREVLRDETSTPVCQDFVPDCASVAMTVIFATAQTKLRSGDTFSYTFSELGDDAKTFIIDSPKTAYSEGYTQQTFTAWESINGAAS